MLLSAAPNRHSKPVTAAPLPAGRFLTSAEPQLPQQLAKNSFSIGDPKAAARSPLKPHCSLAGKKPLTALGLAPWPWVFWIIKSFPGKLPFLQGALCPQQQPVTISALGAEQTSAVTLTLKPPQTPFVAPARHRSCSGQILTLNPSIPEPTALLGQSISAAPEPGGVQIPHLQSLSLLVAGLTPSKRC